MCTEYENKISSYEVASFKTISKEEYQQLLNDKYEGFITVEGRPINVIVAVPHECRICGKGFYNRAVNMLGNAEELHHQCFLMFSGGSNSNSESDKVRKKRLAEIEKVKSKLRKEMSPTG